MTKVMRKHLVLVEVTVHHHAGANEKTALWAIQQMIAAGKKNVGNSLVGQTVVKTTVKSYKRHMSYLRRQLEVK